ncbi:helicase-associated domain-containing protein [Gulosibacter bifidus]|uniref:Helicase-associated domain-containing protein n=1 Tax=Gulosibacter bifidus TaxID=272239 RepID=A0ABW5RIF6_9MICO|nr:helicase-associated domain-containing protein [Gulosibacter bifidus]
MTTPDSLRILRYLRELDAASLAELLTARRVSPRGVNEPLDVAEGLCHPESVTAALLRLPLRLVLALRAEQPAALSQVQELALATTAHEAGQDPEATDDAPGDCTLLDVTREALRTLVPHPVTYPEAQRAATEPDQATAGIQHAFETAQLAADLLWEFRHREVPVRTDRHGIRVRSADLRRLAANLPESEPAIIVLLGPLLHQAGLIAPGNTHWSLTHTGDSFLLADHTERWLQLAAAWFDQLEPTMLAPIDADQPELPLGDELGVTETDQATGRRIRTPLGACILNTDFATARALTERHFPSAVDQVYLQPDLTVIAPGPLSGADDCAIRAVADLEHRATASQFRVSEQSIMRALRAGMRIDAIEDTLTRLSCTGLPQPAQYLLNTCESRFGSVRVRAAGAGARFRALTETQHASLRIDTALSAIAPVEVPLDAALRATAPGVSPTDDASSIPVREFSTRVSPETALATLITARYPAALESADGELVPPTTPKSIDQPPVASPSDAILELASALIGELAQSAPDDERTWIRRKLELARRSKTWVVLEIDVPRKPPVELTVLPLAVTEQRVRARDGDADVERTVPLRSVLSVHELKPDDFDTDELDED